MHDHGNHENSLPEGLEGGARYRTRLLAAFALIAVFFVVELIGGLLTGSLALLSDAAHMFTDVIGLGMAVAAIEVARTRSKGPQQTFGLYRAEVLAAAVNALMLFGVGLYILYEAYERFRNPPEVASGPMLWIACLGLLANVAAFLLLREGAKESINVQGAFLEVLSDLLGSLGVITAALIIRVTGWTYADPLIAAAIGLFVLPRTARLGGQALRILMQYAPKNIDVAALGRRLQEIPGVEGVHDLHVWTLTSSREVASVHLQLASNAPAPSVLEEAQRTLRDEFSISHATIQVETREGVCRETTW